MNINHNQVAVVLYDNILPQYKSVRANLHDFTEFKLNGKQQFTIFETENVSDTLTELTDREFDWAVVIAIGTYLQGQHTVFNTLDFVTNENSPLCCHIINKNNCFYMDSQYFAIDLKTYKQLGCPRFEETDNTQIEIPDILRSTDNVHDDYTPWWIKPGNGTKQQYSGMGHFGIQAVSTYIDAGYQIVNIPQSVRSQKNYSYPNWNYNDLVNLIADPKYAVPENTGLFWFNRDLKVLTNSLNHGYYVINTETFSRSPRSDKTPLDVFIGVCGGFKPACIVGKDNFSEDTKVYLYDISQAAIDWQRYLKTNWDGDLDKFESTFNSFQSQNPTYMPLYYAHEPMKINIDWFLQSANLSAEEFTARWQKYLKMPTEFINLNLLDNDAVDQLIAISKNCSKGAYIWTSNAFFMDYIMFFKSRAWTNQKQQDFINELTSKATKTIVLENCGQLTFIK
jgi:hypothetical protein